MRDKRDVKEGMEGLDGERIKGVKLGIGVEICPTSLTCYISLLLLCNPSASNNRGLLFAIHSPRLSILFSPDLTYNPPIFTTRV